MPLHYPKPLHHLTPLHHPNSNTHRPSASRQRYFWSLPLFSLLVLLLLSAPKPQADPVSSLISVFGGEAVLDDVIQDMRGSIEGAIASAEISTDRQIRHAANEALMLLREAEIAFAGQLDKTLDKLDAEVFTVVESIHSIERAIAGGTDELISAIDDATLDIERIVGNTIFAKYPFVLKRVVGINQLFRNEGQYTIELRGSGFGSSSVSVEQLAIAGNDMLDTAQINRTSQNIIALSYAADTLNKLFDTNDDLSARKIKILPVDLTFERKTERPWYFFWMEDKQESLAHKFYIYLIPNYAGTINFDFLGEHFAWQRVNDFTYIHKSRDNHCSGDCDDQKSFPCRTKRCGSSEQQCVPQRQSTPLREGDERLSNATWSGNMDHHDSAGASVRDNRSCLYFSVRSGTHSHDFRVTAQREKYLKQAGVVSYGNKALPVEFGKTYNLEVPENTRVTQYDFDVIGATLPVSGEIKQGVNNEVIRVLSQNEIGGVQVYTFTVKYPN